MSSNAEIARLAAVDILTILRQAGFESYLAGGCVRDEVLGLAPKDYDIATSAKPEQVLELFPRSRYVGEAFGVVLVYKRRVAVEVATFRSESGYLDGRHPTKVNFTDAKNDALRRDFTINGLFSDPLEKDSVAGKDKVIDYVGGQNDIAKKLVKAIGDPRQRFSEDYLRMLRAVRFAANLGFEIEEHTAGAIKLSAKNISKISRERIGQEIKIMLTGNNPAQAAELVQTLELDAPVLNEKHVYTSCAILTKLGADLPYALALAAWLVDRNILGSEWRDIHFFCENKARAQISKWRKSLVLSNKVYQDFVQIIKIISALYNWPEMDKAQRKRLLANAMYINALRLVKCCVGSELQQIEEDTKRLFAEGVSPAPFVDGKDLIELGAQPGPAFSVILQEAYNEQLSGNVLSSQEALCWLKQRLKRLD